MRALGYVEGKNVIIEARFADAKAERVPALVDELLRLKVDVIVATGAPIYRALQRTARTVPVVVTVTADPIMAGVAETLSRPGGNFTGLSDTATDLGPKQLELLRAIVPKLSRIGVLLNSTNSTHPPQVTRLMLASQKLGVRVVLAEASTVAELDAGVAALSRESAEAIIVLGDSFFSQQLSQIGNSAVKHRLASVYNLADYPETGGLLSYGAALLDNFSRAATYVDKILKGASPGDLPFEQPTRYVLVINTKTARALGLTVPQSLLLRADRVIQ